MAQIDVIIAQVKLLNRKLQKAKTLEEFQNISKDLNDWLKLYDIERGRNINEE